MAVLKELSGNTGPRIGDEVDSLAARAYEKRILKLEQQNKEISRKLVGM